jgi:hypothetical protein
MQFLDINALSLPEAAEAYATKGFPIFPVAGIGTTPNRERRCLCGRGVNCDEPGKHPRVKWSTKATSDLDTVRIWWQKWPEANIALATGRKSGLFVLDIDNAAAEAALAELEASNGVLPQTMVVATGRGRHIYFAVPGGTLPNPTGLAGIKGLDIRADGGYVILPPSRHIEGSTYRWQ